MDRLQKILLSKIQNNMAHHFYMISAQNPGQNKIGHLQAWVLTMLSNALAKNVDTLINHPDLLILSPSNDKKYKNEDFASFFQFLGHSSIGPLGKFIIINQGHTISEVICNKLLKTLEEPPIKLTIFWLQDSDEKSIASISSRATHLKIIADNEPSDSLWQPVKMTLHQFQDELKNNPGKEEECFLFLMSEMTSHPHLNAPLMAFQKIKAQDNTYHNPPTYRRYKMFRMLESLF